MNKQETIKILGILKANYPTQFIHTTRTEAELMVDLWANIFIDVPFSKMSEAIKTFIITDKKGFFPTTGQIVDILYKNNNDNITNVQAWNIVITCLRNCNRNSKKEFEKLPSTIKKVVGTAQQLKNWASLSTTELETKIKYSFMENYKKTRNEINDRKVIENIFNSLPPVDKKEKLLYNKFINKKHND